MIAHAECTHENHKKHGRDRNNHQRYRCRDCGKTWTETRKRPIGHMRIDLDQAEMAVKMMVEGCSIRTIERLTNLHRDTLCDLLVTVGENCRRFLQDTVKDIPASDVQCDELWSYVGMKEKTRQRVGGSFEFGHAYCYVGMDRHTKLVLAHHIGDRDRGATKKFIHKLDRAVDTSDAMISTDGWWAYTMYIPETFRGTTYGQIVKIYASSQDTTRYSPAQIIEARRRAVVGSPDHDRICTSHIERLNLSIRMQTRRFARLTNAFSKKLRNHKAAMALFFAHYNFCRKHKTLKTTPAVEAGLADKVWSVRELLEAAAGEY